MARTIITNSEKLSILAIVKERRANGESLRSIAKSLSLQPKQIRYWDTISEKLSVVPAAKGCLGKKKMLVEQVEKELLQWLLIETEKQGHCVPPRMIVRKAVELCPSFGERSYDAKYKCILRFQKKYSSAISEATPKTTNCCTNLSGNNQHHPTMQKGISRKVFSAKQVAADNGKAPVLPPDFIAGQVFECPDSARLEYKKLLLKHCAKRNAYAPGALYKNLFQENLVILDHDVEGDFDICIEYTQSNNQGKQLVPIPATTWVKVRSAYTKNQLYLRTLLNVDESLDEKKGTVRQGRGDVGYMWQVGVKNRGEKDRKYYKATESTFRYSKDNELSRSLLQPMNYFMSEYFKGEYPEEFTEIQQGNRNIVVDKSTGGDGSLHTFSISKDLGNASHLDRGDESVGIATWVEKEPGRAKNWYFILPNTHLLRDESRAVVVKLSHGLSISWDGRVVHHCTSVTDTGGVENHVYGNFTSKSKRKTLG